MSPVRAFVLRTYQKRTSPHLMMNICSSLPKHQQTHRYTQLNLNQHRISPLQPRNIKNPLFSIHRTVPANLYQLPFSSRPPSPTIMVHVFQTTSLFAVLLVIAMTQGLSVLSSPLTGPTPPGPPREGEGGKGGEHNPPGGGGTP
ncbi:hypothetical protein MJO28_005507 [Puccinia striiformis f. sp. tritici]|uniref:Uncharacterized protein n=1 Tax=Puccinia striiformis f. sp. tritici TaxID=168172 RepID=A0ACC0EM43_9BASI|nr:hypothetical protein MJO28_005507 [Puccinia striiformis f. sp. tritici]